MTNDLLGKVDFWLLFVKIDYFNLIDIFTSNDPIMKTNEYFVLYDT